MDVYVFTSLCNMMLCYIVVWHDVCDKSCIGLRVVSAGHSPDNRMKVTSNLSALQWLEYGRHLKHDQ